MSGSPVADPILDAVVSAALQLVSDGAKVGLGSGRTATAFIAKLGEKVRAGLRVVAVATSDESARRAKDAGIALADLGENELDLTVDGADEVAPNLDVVKGRGGALVRERIVAAASKRQVILIGHEKLVRALGERGAIPVEVIPLAERFVARQLRALGLRPRSRTTGGAPFISDNGNRIIDCMLEAPVADPRDSRRLERDMLAIAGVVDTGLFLGTAERVLVGYPDGRVEILTQRKT